MTGARLPNPKTEISDYGSEISSLKSEIATRQPGAVASPAADPTPADDAPQVLPSGGFRISRAELIQISTQLSVMVDTGVTLSEALDCIAEQSERPQVRQLMQDVAACVTAGADFSSALARHPRSFPRLYIAIVRASEKSGMLAKLLMRATAYLRDEQATIRRVKGALTYPAIMLAFAVTTTVFLLAFVLPRFATIYSSKSAALPLPTRVLMAASDFIVGYWIALIAAALTVVIGGYLYLQSDGGMRLWHRVQLRIPVIGKVLRQLHLARGMRMIGTMAGAGVTLVDSVSTARDLCGNTCFGDLWTDVEEKIKAGRQLSDPLFDSPLVPRAVAQMAFSGEKSGRLSTVLEQIATASEEELKEKVADLTRYIEPAMIIIMGLIIGGITLALLLPIFTISRVMGH